MPMNALPPVHPGEILREDVLPATGFSATAAAQALGIPITTFREILAERQPLSPSVCQKVAQHFGSTPELWLRLQSAYDLKTSSIASPSD